MARALIMSESESKTAEEIANDPLRPAAPLRTDTFRKQRPHIVGGDAPETPFPILLSGSVQRGFGRGGKDLGCPTGTNASRTETMAAHCMIVVTLI